VGEAKRKKEIIEKQSEKFKNFPRRALKSLVGVILSPFVIAFMVGMECFQEDKWPWSDLS